MKIFKKIISFVVFCSLIFTRFSGVFATESKSLDFHKKIEELKDYKDDDFVDAIIKLKKQVDVSKIKDAVKKENVNASKEEIQNEIRKDMVDKSIKLKEDSQKSIIEILERFKKDGNVKNYQQFFIINCINVVCKKEVLVKISKRSDVEKISINKKVKIPKLQNNIPEDMFIHIDIPLTLEHQCELMKNAGFKSVQVLYQNCGTVIIKAEKSRNTEKIPPTP